MQHVPNSTNNLTEDAPSQGRSWFVVLIAASFFFYEFIQMNMFNTISRDLLEAFQISAGQLGLMSSMYFVSNVVFLFVAGVVLDRYSTRWVILIALGICVLGTALFAIATTFYFAMFCRFLTGIGSAFCFLSVIRLASRWFPARRMALVVGVVTTIAMIGGMVAQTPLSYLVDALQWRHALLVDAALGGFFIVLIALFVKDYPLGHQAQHQEEQQQLQELSYPKKARLAFLRLQNWMGGIYTSLMNLPINVLGGLWGGVYLMVTHHLLKHQAANVSSMLFFGAIFGCPVAGWVSDRLALRRLPMVLGALITLVLIGLAVSSINMSYTELLILFFAIGFFTSTQVISYALVAESSLRIVTAMSVSVVNISAMTGIGLVEPLYGYLIDTHMKARLGYLTHRFVSSDFHWPMIIFFIAVVIALLAALLVKETHAVQRAE